MTSRKVVPFNPLDKRHLGENIGQALLNQPVEGMTDLGKFTGAGIYAIYYTGDFAPYAPIAARNIDDQFRAPIYVGKAVPRGARKGGSLEAPPGNSLYNRLRKHLQSLEQAGNLDSGDFHWRYLVVDDIWRPLGESLLIASLAPLWNLLVDGFGNHDPGAGRHAGLRPRWDVLHPGRPWADRCEPREESQEQIIHEITEHLRNYPPPEDNSLVTT